MAKMPKDSVYEMEHAKSIEVTWGRDSSHVQVGARFAGQPFLFVDPAMNHTDSTAEEPYAFESLHVTLLHRGQVNELIRVLRRARDQAFGADA